jgi:cell division septum initiation protein DivIVA
MLKRIEALEERAGRTESSLKEIPDAIQAATREATTAATFDFGIITFKDVAKILERLAKKIPPEGGR